MALTLQIFLCHTAISAKKSWGEQVTKLTQPDAWLVTLVFPIDDRETGPPYSVSVEAYAEVLGPTWKKLIDRVPSESTERNKGKERIVVWRKVVS